MEVFVAYPSRWRLAMLILCSTAFVAAGLWMAGIFGAPPTSRRYSPELIELTGWVCVLFFGLCGFVGVKRLFASGVELRIDATGIYWVRWSDQTIPWHQIARVAVWRYGRQEMIILHLLDPERYRGRGILGATARANRMLTGGDIGIPMNAMDRSVGEVMAAIERLRR